MTLPVMVLQHTPTISAKGRWAGHSCLPIDNEAKHNGWPTVEWTKETSLHLRCMKGTLALGSKTSSEYFDGCFYTDRR